MTCVSSVTSITSRPGWPWTASSAGGEPTKGTVSCPDQGEPIVFGEVGEVFDVQRREWQVIGKTARGDPCVIDWAGPTALSGGGGQFTPDGGDALAAGDHGLAGQPRIQHRAVAWPPAPQPGPLDEFTDGYKRYKWLRTGQPHR